MSAPVPELIDRYITGGPQAPLERMYIEEYLKSRGIDLSRLNTLPPEQAKQLMREACIYASNRLAEVESRANFRKDIQAPAR